MYLNKGDERIKTKTADRKRKAAEVIEEMKWQAWQWKETEVKEEGSAKQDGNDAEREAGGKDRKGKSNITRMIKKNGDGEVYDAR